MNIETLRIITTAMRGLTLLINVIALIKICRINKKLEKDQKLQSQEENNHAN